VRVAVVGTSVNDGTASLVEGWRALGIPVSLTSAVEALRLLRPGDVALLRLDVLPSLDGVEPGLLAALALERRGVEVLNPVDSLLGAHDKLRTARLLAAARLPHPRTSHVRRGARPAPVPPVVLKPRFGSWGADVALCRSAAEVEAYLERVDGTRWFRRHGLLVQEPLPSPGHDLRVLVAAGRVVGCVRRIAAAGEWRTNVSCGGAAERAAPPPGAAELAATAAAVVGCDFVGVDLMPVGQGRFVVLELNAAVDFDAAYAPPHEDVYRAAACALGLGVSHPAAVAAN